MQCTSYLSGHHYSGDRIIAASGGLWPQFDSGVSCRNARDYSILFQPPNIDQCLSYNKDLLKDIMLNHEAIFKYQMYELHRLYGRQRELMDELQMKKLSTNCFVSRMQSDISQKALQQIPYCLLSNPRDNEPPAQGVENFQKPSTFVPGNSIPMGSDLYTVENDFNELEASSSRRNKFRKRLLDLELPAELYMETDEGEQLEEKKPTEIHPVLHDPSMDISNSSKNSNVVPSEGTSTNMNLSSPRMSYVFDLNEPVQVDEPKNSTSSMYSNMNSTEIMHQDQDLSGSSRSKSSVLNKIVHGILEEKGGAGSSFTSGLQVSFSGKLPLACTDRAGVGLECARNEQDFIDSNRQKLSTSSMTTSSSLVPLSNDTNAIRSFNNPRDVPIVVQALPYFNTPALNRTSRTSTGSIGIEIEYLCPNLNAACSPSLGSITSHVSCNTENQSTDEQYYVPSSFRDLDCTKSVVHLNLNVMPSISFPKTEASREKVKVTDGMVNLDLNVMPCSSLSETGVSQEKVESLDGNSGLDSFLGKSNEIGDKPDYDGKIVVHPILLEPLSSSSPFSARSSMNSPSSSFENEDIQNHEKTKIPARVVPRNSSYELEKRPKDDTYLGTEIGTEISVAETCIQLPFTFGEEKLSQLPTVADGVGTGFEAPDSPDKEPSPPREGSEDNQREQLEDSNKDLDRIAAEAIVSMSFSGEQQCLKNSISGPLEASVDCLNWFAGIVSSAAGYVENELDDILSDAPGGFDCNQFSFNALEYFEAKTIKSIGTKVEDSFCKTMDQENKIIGDMVLPNLRRRGRRARNAGEQKEIQSEVAPKELTVATRNATKTVKGRRNVGKIGRAIGKRLSSKSFPNLAGRRVCSLSKQQQQQQQQHTHERSEQSFMQSWLFGWGKKNRRQKHKRAKKW